MQVIKLEENMNAQNIGGYFYDFDTKTLPVFINYDKAENAIAYEDRFVTQAHLIALSKHPRKIDSSDADHFLRERMRTRIIKYCYLLERTKMIKKQRNFIFRGNICARGTNSN